MTGPGETASLADQILGGYREHAAGEAGIAAIPGRVLGSDVEGQVDAMAAAAAELRRQGWPGPDDEEDLAAAAAWKGTVESLQAAAGTLGRAAGG